MKRALLAGGTTTIVALAILACSSDPERPPASSGGSSTTSSGGGSSSGGTSADGSATPDGSSSGGGLDGGTNVDPSSIAAGLRASIDNAATEFADAPTAGRLSNGFVVDLSGKDTFGNELRLTLTNTATAVAPGRYDCTGSAGETYGVVSYVVTGGTATWTALASGECTITILSIDNQAGGIVVGTFGGTAKRAASTERLITKGQFRLTLE
jgi:hypothetical protein